MILPSSHIFINFYNSPLIWYTCVLTFVSFDTMLWLTVLLSDTFLLFRFTLLFPWNVFVYLICVCSSLLLFDTFIISSAQHEYWGLGLNYICITTQAYSDFPDLHWASYKIDNPTVIHKLSDTKYELHWGFRQKKKPGYMISKVPYFSFQYRRNWKKRGEFGGNSFVGLIASERYVALACKFSR